MVRGGQAVVVVVVARGAGRWPNSTTAVVRFAHLGPVGDAQCRRATQRHPLTLPSLTLPPQWVRACVRACVCVAARASALLCSALFFSLCLPNPNPLTHPPTGVRSISHAFHYLPTYLEYPACPPVSQGPLPTYLHSLNHHHPPCNATTLRHR